MIKTAVVLLTILSCLSLASGNNLPAKVMGMYVLLADDATPGYTSHDQWTPALFPYQQHGANVLFFTFIEPGSMVVPPAFTTLAKTRGNGKAGSVPTNTTIIFAIGGYAYSLKPNPWPWLASPSAATEMAKKVAQWSTLHGCDGIDLDIETGAGDASGAGANMIVFIRELKKLAPHMLITQPVFGYPQVAAELAVVNNAWNANSSIHGAVQSVGIMVYDGTQALDYVKNYVNATHQWSGFPITVDVPSNSVVCGMGGEASSNDILSMASSIHSRSLRGIMVWYASVINTKTGKSALQYDAYHDASTKGTQDAWRQALSKM